ncbi:MAG: hypothetical protein HYZ42_06980 [Bacteroidetes bacterium]|nr:hypothetical protein [Bacteroidota bacterium]
MKRNIILFVVFVAVLLVYLGSQKGWFKTSHGERRDFAVTDTAHVDKIYMTNKAGKEILLEKKEGIWMLNGKYEANNGWLKQLFETIYKVKVKSPLPKNAINPVIKNLSFEHVKVEIYINGEINKTYFVGGSTQDRMGTYMWIENSDVPFICEIPGWEGFIQPRYNLEENTWRSRKDFAFDPSLIQEVSVKYNDPSKNGFIIQQNKDQVSIKNLSQSPLNNMDSLMAKYYLALFKEVHAEAFGMVFKEENSDSIRNSPYWCRMEIKYQNKTVT